MRYIRRRLEAAEMRYIRRRLEAAEMRYIRRRLEAAEMWYIRRRLEAAEMRYIRRRIMRISWTEKKSKRRSNGNGRIQKIPTQDHQKKTTTIFVHIHRADGLEKQILNGKICGISSRGRQRTKYTDSLNNLVTKESPNNELTRKTDDKEDWKAMIADVCYRLGP